MCLFTCYEENSKLCALRQQPFSDAESIQNDYVISNFNEMFFFVVPGGIWFRFFKTHRNRGMPIQKYSTCIDK